jgi:hypothetical protein
MIMALKTVGIVEIPDAAGSEFDHAAFDPVTRRIFVAHTCRDRIEVIDHDAGNHVATLPGFPGSRRRGGRRRRRPRDQSRLSTCA